MIAYFNNKTNNSCRRKSPTIHPYFCYLLWIYNRPGFVKCKRQPFFKLCNSREENNCVWFRGISFGFVSHTPFKEKKTNVFEDCNRQKISVDRCEQLGKWKTWKLAQERWVVYLFFELIAVIAFHFFIKHTAVIARRIR
jgi:hypothetical protein